MVALVRAAARLLQDVSGSRFRYVMLVWPLASLPSMLVGAVVAMVYLAYDLPMPRDRAASSLAAKLYTVFGAPPLETALMLLTYYLLGIVIWRAHWLRIAVLAVLSALFHLAGGGWAHVIGVLWGFAVLSIALGAWESRRTRDAFIVVTAIHMLHNATIVLLQSAVEQLASQAAPSMLSMLR